MWLNLRTPNRSIVTRVQVSPDATTVLDLLLQLQDENPHIIVDGTEFGTRLVFSERLMELARPLSFYGLYQYATIVVYPVVAQHSTTVV